MDLCEALIGTMRENAVSLSALSFCILIKGYGRAGDMRGVRRAYSTMLRRSVSPDLATFNALLDACHNTPSLRRVCLVHHAVTRLVDF